jgi:hypothetical protein
MSAIHMPSMVAEKCYHLLDQYMSHLLSEGNSMSTFTHKDAQTIHLLATTIKKLKNRSAVNESMEMFGFFMDGLSRRKPELAEAVAPEIEKYMTIRKNVTTADFMLDGFNQAGKIPYPDNDVQEQLADQQDEAELARDFEEFMATRATAPAQPQTASVSEPETPAVSATQPTATTAQPLPHAQDNAIPETQYAQETPLFIPTGLDYRDALDAMRKYINPEDQEEPGTTPIQRIPKPGSDTSKAA